MGRQAIHDALTGQTVIIEIQEDDIELIPVPDRVEPVAETIEEQIVDLERRLQELKDKIAEQ